MSHVGTLYESLSIDIISLCTLCWLKHESTSLPIVNILEHWLPKLGTMLHFIWYLYIIVFQLCIPSCRFLPLSHIWWFDNKYLGLLGSWEVVVTINMALPLNDNYRISSRLCWAKFLFCKLSWKYPGHVLAMSSGEGHVLKSHW